MSETNEDEPTRPGIGPGDEPAKIPQVEPPLGPSGDRPPTTLPPLEKVPEPEAGEPKPKSRGWFVVLAWITLIGLGLFTAWITIIALRLPAMLESQRGGPTP